MLSKLSSWLKLSSKHRKIVIPTLLGLLITFLFVNANFAKPPQIEQMGNLLFDAYQKKKPREYNPDTPVRIVDIDDESIEKLGQWPWPRTIIAKLNDRLADAGAAVIAYDIVFSEPDRTSPKNIAQILKDNPAARGSFENLSKLTDHDTLLADSFARSKVVAAFFLVAQETEKRPAYRHGFAWKGAKPTMVLPSYHGAITSMPELEAEVSGEGHVSITPDGDGIIRLAPLISVIGEEMYPALSVEALRVATGASTYIMSSSDGSGGKDIVGTKNPKLTKMTIGNFEIPTSADGELLVYYSRPEPNLRVVKAWEILSDDVPTSTWAHKVEGQIIFVGTSAIGLKDFVATPFQAGVPGVLVHAQVVEQIIEGNFLKRTYTTESTELWTLLFLGVFLAILLPRLGAAKGAVLSLLVAGSVAYGSWYGFAEHQLLINPVYILLAILTSYLLITLSSFYITESERSQIRSAFSMYLSPTMVKKVSEDPSLLKLGGEERILTILFLDIRSFSKISEGLEPEEITTFLNIFLSPMTTILQDNGATIDKYMGDAIVAFWNAPLDDPDHERNGARAVRKMMKTLGELNEKYAKQDEIKWPDNVKVGIGLNTGICCVGNLGSEQRFSYSMIGDAANLASRIEGLTKQYKVSVLIGNATAEKLPELAIIEADLIQVIGRQTPERIHILAGEEKMAKTDAYKTLMPIHTRFLEAYRKQNWEKAEGFIPALQELAKDMGFSGYYDVMLTRINAYKTDPPDANWGGVYVAQSK